MRSIASLPSAAESVSDETLATAGSSPASPAKQSLIDRPGVAAFLKAFFAPSPNRVTTVNSYKGWTVSISAMGAIRFFASLENRALRADITIQLNGIDRDAFTNLCHAVVDGYEPDDRDPWDRDTEWDQRNAQDPFDGGRLS